MTKHELADLIFRDATEKELRDIAVEIATGKSAYEAVRATLAMRVANHLLAPFEVPEDQEARVEDGLVEDT